MTKDFFRTSCSGTLETADLTVSITFELVCSQEGDVSLRIDDVPLTAVTLRLHDVFNDASSETPRALRLAASDSTGRLVTSDTVYLTTCGTRTNDAGRWVTLDAVAVGLVVTASGFDPEALAAGVRAAYYAIGLRGFGTHEVDTRAGRLGLLAKHTVENYNEISGRFDIQAFQSAASSIRQWVEVADEVALDILDLVSFAEGRLIRWSVRHLIIDTSVVAMEFRGPSRTGPPRRGFYHWLDIQPVLELAAQNYTPELKSSTGIDVALEWSLMNPRYLELDFVACVTALEHLSDIYEKKHKKAAPPGRAYFDSTIEPALTVALQQLLAAASDREAVGAIQKALGKIRDLTRATLQDSIERMLSGYGVPFVGLDGVLPELIKLRNSIVHEGVARKRFQPKLQQHVNAIRELLTRIFLTLLRYSGRYYSYLHGEQFISFPPE